MSSGGGGNQTTTQEFKPPEYTRQPWQDFTRRGVELSNTPYQQYTGDRMARDNPTQQYGQQAFIDRVSYGNATDNAARAIVTRQMEGGFQNPYADQRLQMPTNPLSGEPGGSIYNPMIGRSTTGLNRQNSQVGNLATAGTNEYAGMDNPYFKQSLSNSINDIVGNYGTAVMPGINAQATFNNAFGGSGHAFLQSQAQGNLARELGRTINDAYMGEYRNQQGLREGAINRDLGAQQFNIQNQAGLDDAFIQRQIGLGTGDVQRDASLYESGIGRGMDDLSQRRQLNEAAINRGQQQFNLDRDVNSGMWERGLDRSLGQVGAAQAMRQQDLEGYKNIIGLGDSAYAKDQTALDQQYQDWLNQQNWALQMQDVLGNTLSRASGVGGQNVSTVPYSRSNNALGLGLLGAGLLG